MTPRWKMRRYQHERYDLVAQIWAADIYRIRVPTTALYDWALILSPNENDQFWFDTHQFEQLLYLMEDRWLGHLPDGFEDQVRAVVALYQH